MKVRFIKETSIYVEDLDRTKTFYSLIGLESYSESKGRHVFFRAGTSMLLCFQKDFFLKNNSGLPEHGANGKIHLAFEVDENEFDNTKSELMAKNIIIEHEHYWEHGNRSLYFRDPDGHLLEVVTPGLWD